MIFSNMMKFKWLILIVLVASACSSYEKVLKSTDYKMKYRKAFEYYNSKDYVKAGAIFDQIAPLFRGTKNADSVYYFQAMSYYQQGDYILSGHYFKVFANTYGGSKFVQDANFYVGYCYYLTSPRPELDQTNTSLAIQAFQLFIVKYPNSDRVDECNKLIAELRNKLVEKSFLSAQLYYNLEDYKAAIVSLNNSLTEYPGSIHREDIMYMLVKSNYLLASNSVQSKVKERFQSTLDEYYSFIAEYPDSKYKKEVDKIYNQSAKVLNINTKQDSDLSNK